MVKFSGWKRILNQKFKKKWIFTLPSGKQIGDMEIVKIGYRKFRVSYNVLNKFVKTFTVETMQKAYADASYFRKKLSREILGR